MKNIRHLLLPILIFLLISCNKKDESFNIDCDNLTTYGLIEMESETVRTEINKLTVDLSPNISKDDEWGHKNNLDLLITRINTQCDYIDATLDCYACIETYPPQSEIIVLVDSSGYEVKRVIDISTPNDTVLRCKQVHRYYR